MPFRTKASISAWLSCANAPAAEKAIRPASADVQIIFRIIWAKLYQSRGLPAKGEKRQSHCRRVGHAPRTSQKKQTAYSRMPSRAKLPSFLQKNGLDCRASITRFQTRCRYFWEKGSGA